MRSRQPVDLKAFGTLSLCIPSGEMEAAASSSRAREEIPGSSEAVPEELLNSEFYKIVKMCGKEPEAKSDSESDKEDPPPDTGPAFIERKMGSLERSKFQVNSIYGGDTTALHVACEFGNLELVEYLLDHSDVEIRKKDAWDGDNAVHSAAVGGEVAILKRLALAVPDFVRNVNKHGRSPLHLALGKGRKDMAEFLISKKADLHLKDKTGATPLHFAARNGTRELLQLLKENDPGMDANQKSGAGLTALHYAAWNGRVEAVKWLCAQKDIRLGEADSVEKNTALHWAAQGGHWEVVELLVRAHLARGTVHMFKENKHNETVLELMETHAPSKLLHLLHLFNKKGLLDMKAFPPTVLVKFVMGYGDIEMLHNLEQGLVYAMKKEKLESRYLSALKNLLQSDSELTCWLATRGNQKSGHLYLKLKDEEHLKLNDLHHRNVAAALRNAILKGNVEFANVLADHGRKKEVLGKWFDCMDKDLTGNLKATAESMYNMLSERNRAGLTASGKLIEDIPLAFWIFESPDTSMAQFLEKHNAWALVINQQGSTTRRTALHWANILQESQIAAKLSEVKEGEQGKKDVHGKTASQYATTYRKEERSVYIDALKSILVAAALLASIEFTGFVMSQPLGYPSSRQAAATVNTSMQIFWVCSCSAFFLAMASGLACLGGILPMPDVDLSEIAGKTERALLVASSLLVFSICFALSAFFCSVFADVRVPGARERPGYWKELLLTSVIGVNLCVALVLSSFRRSCWPSLRHIRSWVRDILGPSLRGLISWPFKHSSRSTKTNSQTDPESAAADAEASAGASAGSRVVYEVGPRYKEYPWEDGLDKLWEQQSGGAATVTSAAAAAVPAAAAAEAQVQSGRNSTEDDNRQLLAPHRRSPVRPGYVCFARHYCHLPCLSASEYN